VRAVVITGAAGFIGATFCRTLLDRGTPVVGVDVAPPDAWWRLAAYVSDPRLTRVAGDVRDEALLRECVADAGLVVHLAAATDMTRGADGPGADVVDAVSATQAVLDAMRATGVRSIVYASSSAVYGDLAAQRPARESDGPLLPVSVYGASKLAGEAVVSAYAALFGLRALVVRPGTVLGPDLDRGVVPAVVAQVRDGRDHVELLGDGTQARSFVLAEDLVEATLLALDAAAERCHVVNVGGQGTTSTRDVARIVLGEAGRPDLEVRFAGGDRGWHGDVPVVALDLARIRAAGWTPRPSDEAVRTCARSMLAAGVRVRSTEPNARARPGAT
jgi:UDP-glucose 4-epimerase